MTLRYRRETPQDFDDGLCDEDIPDARSHHVGDVASVYRLPPKRAKKKPRVQMVPTGAPPKGEYRQIMNEPLPPPLAALWAYCWSQDAKVTAFLLHYWFHKDKRKDPVEFLQSILSAEVRLSINKYGIELLKNRQRVPFNAFPHPQELITLIINCLPKKDSPQSIWKDACLTRNCAIQQLSDCRWNGRLAREIPKERVLVIMVAIINDPIVCVDLRAWSEDLMTYPLSLRNLMLKLYQALGCSQDDERYCNVMQYLPTTPH